MRNLIVSMSAIMFYNADTLGVVCEATLKGRPSRAW